MNGQVTFIKTDNGTHPPAKWAEVCCSELIVISTESAPDSPARKLELQVLELLENYFTNVQASEIAGLDEDGDGKLESPLDGHEHDPEEIVTGVVGMLLGTAWEEHSKRKDFQQRIREVVTKYTILCQDVERSTWADKNPSEQAEAWKNARTNLGVTQAHTFNQE